MNSHFLAAISTAALAAALLAGCGDTTAPTFTIPPVVQQNPNPAVPMAAIVSAVTDEPSELVIEVSEGENSWTVPATGEFSTQPSAAVIGFRAGRKHEILVSARDQAGNITVAPVALEFDVAALPEDFPPIKVVKSVPERMEPGVTLFAVMKWPDGGAEDATYGLAVAVDDQGEVVWYYRTDEMIEDPHRLPNGNLLCLVDNNRAEEIDMLGNVVASWHASQHPNPEARAKVREGSIPVATDTLHHEISQLASGNFLALSTELREVDNYPTDVTKPSGETAKANVVGDVVVEFTRDGSIVNEWKLMDILDVRRLGYESLTGIWNIWAYVDVPDTKDWAHANSVFYNSSDDSIIVSLRHQEAVIKFSRETGELIWILGSPDGWGDRWKPYLLKPEGELEWNYHQHAAEVTPQGTLLLYDNGNYRGFPPAEKMGDVESYSRVVEFEINAESMSVRQVWKYGAPEHESFFSPFICEADPLPTTGNILITDGGRIRDKQGRQSAAIVGGRHWARIFEVTHSDPPEKVFELVVDSSEKDNSIGWAIYRSDRLPSLYGN